MRSDYERLCTMDSYSLFLFAIAEVFQRKDVDQDNLIKIEMSDVSIRALFVTSHSNEMEFIVFVLFSVSQWIKSVLRC